jgi:hypothetical protein
MRKPNHVPSSAIRPPGSQDPRVNVAVDASFRRTDVIEPRLDEFTHAVLALGWRASYRRSRWKSWATFLGVAASSVQGIVPRRLAAISVRSAGSQTRTVVPWASATSAVIAAGLGATTCWRSSLVTIISIARYGKKGTGAWPLFASQRTRLELHRVRYGDDRVRPERAKACARPDRCARAAGESARRSWFVLDAQRPCRDPLACALRAEVCNAPASGVASPGTAAESARRNRIAESGVCV